MSDVRGATVAGAPVLVAEVDEREGRLRATRLASALPRPGTSEGRQLRRWLTQLLVTERVVAAEVAARDLTADGAPTEEDLMPDTVARMEIGSVAASVLRDARRASAVRRTSPPVSASPMPRSRSTIRAIPALRHAGRRRRRLARDPQRRRRSTTCDPPSPRTCSRPRAAASSGAGSTRGAPSLVELAPGYEHPGDPRQPDNTHRH